MEMMSEEDVSSDDVIIIDSDNYASQYKSGLHFHHLHQITNTSQTSNSHVWDFRAWEGRSGPCWGTAKVTTRRMAASGKVFFGADNIAEFLNEKSISFKSPRYVIKSVLEKELETACKETRRIKVKAIENS